MPPGIISWKEQPRTTERELWPRIHKTNKWYVKLYLACFWRPIKQSFPWWRERERSPPHSHSLKMAFLSFKKVKNWKFLPVPGNFLLVFAKEFLKFAPFLQNYRVSKCKSAHFCNKKCPKLGDFTRERLSPPPPIPTHPPSPVDGRNLKIHLAPVPYSADRCALIILSE